MNNLKKIKIENFFALKKNFQEISFVGNLIFWIANTKKGDSYRNSIFVRPFGRKDLKAQKLIGSEFHIKSFFHGYGGKSYQCFEIDKKIYLIWFDQLSKSLWFQMFETNISNKQFDIKYLVEINKPRKLTDLINGNIDSCFGIFYKKFLIGLIEVKNKDYLFSLDLSQINQELKIIRECDDFAGYLSSESGSNFLSWLEWSNPYMPWQKNKLYFGAISQNGELKGIKEFKNKLINLDKKVSFIQPYWISKDTIVCSEDSTGWWNLVFIEIKSLEQINIKKRITKRFCEYGIPQWNSGISLFSGSKDNLFCISKNKNRCILEQYKEFILVKQFELPFSALRDLYALKNKLIFHASSFDLDNTLIELDLDNQVNSFNIIKKNYEKFSISCVKAKSFWFDGFQGRSTHAWIYEPINKIFDRPPLIVKAHSGPTSFFDGTFNKEVQFWVSRGWFVAEVNYAGSSGFGRDYIDRLNGYWGIADSYDCQALAKNLLELQLIDKNRIAVFGNSAGGLTALNALYDNEIFSAAICKYPVSDLIDMNANTHRFEKDYLNSLIGEYDKRSNDYFTRSPINNIEKINQPTLFFHGKQDSVISYKKTIEINDKLKSKNLNSIIKIFADEGHGFSNLNNKYDVLKTTEKFIYEIFYS